MLAMIATQIAITACLGCVPIDDGAMHSERSTWSDAETHLQLTHTPKAADYGAVAEARAGTADTLADGQGLVLGHRHRSIRVRGR